MKTKLPALIAAGAAVGFLTMSGITLASAQDSTTTTTPSTTVAPDATNPADGTDRPHCAHDDGTDTTAPDTAPAPAAAEGT